MDQFLANQLTKSGIFEVVTDPKSRRHHYRSRGRAFEEKLDDCIPRLRRQEGRRDQARHR